MNLLLASNDDLCFLFTLALLRVALLIEAYRVAARRGAAAQFRISARATRLRRCLS